MESNLNYAEIGRNIRRFRIKAGLKQNQLAEKIGVTPQHISHIESGEHISLSTLVNICMALSVSADCLLGCNFGNHFCEQQDQLVLRAAKLLANSNLKSAELKRFISILEALEEPGSLSTERKG